MNFAFTEDQRFIRDQARSFLDERATFDVLRKTVEGDADWSQPLWEAVGGELGWCGIAIPEEFGGSGLGQVELAILLEETGRTLLPAPFFSTVALAVPAILAAGTDDQKAALLPDIASGATSATFAFGAAPAADGIAAILAKQGSGLVLSGEAAFVPHGHVADLLLIPARAPGSAGNAGISLVALPASHPGVAIEKLTSLDLTRPLARIRFDQVAVGPEQVLGAPEGAGAAFARTLDIGAALLAAEQVGGAERCLEFTTEYAKQRVQFGRLIGSFQAVKHRLADMMVVVEAAKSAAYYAACAIDEAPQELAEAAAVARSYCSDAFSKCAADAIQLHGGIGFTWEHHAHLYFKRARASATLLGAPSHHRETLAQLIGLDG